MGISSLGRAAVALAACLVAGAALADEMADARALLGKGQPAEAYAILEPLESARAGNVDFDYLLGVAAYDSKRFDRAVIAFERALISSPGFFSARFDLARAYFALGADDLAQQEFERLLKANPTPEGVAAIRSHLEAIETRRKGKGRRFKAYFEAGGGHDSNLSSATPDFTNAIGGAFGIPGVIPTGNSVLHSSPYGSFGGGLSGVAPIAEGIELVGSLDIRGRSYSRNSEFDYQLFDLQLGAVWSREGSSIQASAVGQAFRQDGAAPVPASGEQPKSDRNAAGVNVEARHAFGSAWEGFAIAQYMRLRYPSNSTQDTNQGYLSAGVLHATGGSWPGLWLANAYYSKDKAASTYSSDPNNPVIDVGRHTAGVRGYLQRDFTPPGFGRSNGYLLLAWSRRTDDAPFARATTIEIGRDDLTEVTLGLVLPRGRWSLRPTVTYLRNSSNIELYTFKRTDGSIVVRYEFP